jgi:hypothetical protein
MDGNMLRGANTSMNQQYHRGNGWKWLLIIIVVLVLLGAAGFVAKKALKKQSVDSEYQAVFLTNGQVYFGKLDFSRGWVVLKDIYYLQINEDLQPASSGNSNTSTNTTTPPQQNQKIQLVKLGSELHGPKDEMFIAKDKILFWENMKDDSKVLQSIKQFKSQ